MTARPAAFLDRDGCLVEEKGFLKSPDEMVFTRDAPAALRRLKEAGYLLIVVSNQSGIGRRYVARETVEAIHARMRLELEKAGSPLDAIYYCEHVPEDRCDCRKPRLGLVERACCDFAIDLERSFVAGDRASDLALAKRFGGCAVLVETGYGRKVPPAGRVLADVVAPDLAAAVDRLLGGGTGPPAVPDSPRRILIVRLSALGDGVHALPLANALRRAYPDAVIDWAAGSALAKFLSGHPALSNVRVVERTVRGFLAARREVAGRYDVAIDPQGLLKSALLARAAAPRRIGFASPRERAAAWFYTDAVEPPRGPFHVIERNLALLAPLDLAAGRVVFRIPETPLRDDLAAATAERPIGLAPGGAWATKRWPVAHWIALARELAERAPVVVVWGPKEEAEARRIAKEAGVPILPPTSFKDLVAVLPRLRKLVAVESGPLHLAAALGVPTISLIGPTDPDRNGAYGLGHRAVVARPPCHPCYARTCANWICMPAIEPRHILNPNGARPIPANESLAPALPLP